MFRQPDRRLVSKFKADVLAHPAVMRCAANLEELAQCCDPAVGCPRGVCPVPQLPQLCFSYNNFQTATVLARSVQDLMYNAPEQEQRTNLTQVHAWRSLVVATPSCGRSATRVLFGSRWGCRARMARLQFEGVALNFCAPSFTQAVRSLTKYDFIGLTDAFPASVCLFLHMYGFQAQFEKDCLVGPLRGLPDMDAQYQSFDNLEKPNAWERAQVPLSSGRRRRRPLLPRASRRERRYAMWVSDCLTVGASGRRFLLPHDVSRAALMDNCACASQ
jgi:hypothetical protein